MDIDVLCTAAPLRSGAQFLYNLYNICVKDKQCFFLCPLCIHKS